MHRHTPLPWDEEVGPVAATSPRSAHAVPVQGVAPLAVGSSKVFWCWTQHSPTNYAMVRVRDCHEASSALVIRKAGSHHVL